MASAEIAIESRSGAQYPSLDRWVAANGPLWAPDALVIALQLCAHASRLDGTSLASVIDSLNPAGIVRRPQEGWSWVPAPATTASRTISDGEVIARVGAVLFYVLTGQVPAYQFESEHSLKARLRTLRPELPAHVVDVVARALMANQTSGLGLPSFSQDLRQALGLARRPSGQARHMVTTLCLVGTLLTAVLWFAWTHTTSSREPATPRELTNMETTAFDIASETAQTLALIGEHTAAIQTYQRIGLLWSARIPLDDPRLAWNGMHDAWVRTLGGDRLTAEQLMERAPASLTRQLGETHPYVRVARLALADTLAARGELTRANSERTQAQLATHKLFLGADRDAIEFDRAPVPPGVIAHVAPNAPFREGFRKSTDGFAIPLTSAQRWIAGKNGWRLHVTAAGSCHASFVSGSDPRVVGVHVIRSVDGRWRFEVGGATNQTTLDAPVSGKVHVSVAMSATGVLTINAEHAGIRETNLEKASSVAVPPYSLAFSDATSCEVVWLEILFPSEARFAPTSPQIQ